MSKKHNLVDLVVKRLTMTATPAEIEELENWASLSEENSIWLYRFYNVYWVKSRIDLYRSFDIEDGRQKMWDTIRTRQITKRIRCERRRKYLPYCLAVLLGGLLIYFIGRLLKHFLYL